RAEGGISYRPRKVQLYDDIYAAYRRCLHETRLYRNEVDLLAKVRATIDDARQTINREWVSKISEARQNELTRLAHDSLGAAVVLLGQCRDIDKVSAAAFAA